MTRPIISKFKQNSTGKDYIVSDIHGEYDNLIFQLENNKDIQFNFKKDRLFCVGDLIDRGSKSFECLKLLNEKWFFSILGNHEIDMMQYYYNNHISKKTLQSNEGWIKNGGKWFFELTSEEQDEVYNLCKSLPLFIEIETKFNNKKIGLNHADFSHDNWDYIYYLEHQYTYNLYKLSKNTESNNNNKNFDEDKYFFDMYKKYFSHLSYGRERFKTNNVSLVKNISKVITGHTMVQNQVNPVTNEKTNNPFYLGNVLFLDTGAYMRTMLLNKINQFKYAIDALKNGETSIENIKIEQIMAKIFVYEKIIIENVYNLSFYDIQEQKIIKGI